MDITCFHCEKKGHYARKCYSHNVHEVEVEEVKDLFDNFCIKVISLNTPKVNADVN